MFGDFDLNALMGQVQKMTEDLESVKEELEAKDYTATAGGSLVSVTINGKGDLKTVDISPEAWDPDDTETLSALIVAAFRAAKAQSDAAMEAAMPAMPQIPGMGG